MHTGGIREEIDENRIDVLEVPERLCGSRLFQFRNGLIWDREPQLQPCIVGAQIP